MRFYSDNPVRDAERYIAYQDKHYAPDDEPVCWFCEKPFGYSEVYTTGGGHEVCEDCYNKHFAEDEEGE